MAKPFFLSFGQSGEGIRTHFTLLLLLLGRFILNICPVYRYHPFVDPSLLILAMGQQVNGNLHNGTQMAKN